ncbi:Dolichyl-diphosphooligosaccharide--protein glycosyltransferase subunit Swp1 [Auriculariales sp. MPI-PUGE-AT-0066]|nr:Dolichyl-diphosphooligosaccharide--protein glycosyltransferase subunit Swp1 [Auriculariales sp. MPI-PUGE-AT-0066]
MRAFYFAALALSHLASAAKSTPLSISNARFTITTEGSQEPVRSGPLSLAHPITPPLNLTSQDTLKLSFSVFVRPDESDGAIESVVPHQTFLRFYDPESGEEGIQPVRVKPGGKAKFDLVVAKPPTSIPATPAGGPLQVTLILGSFKYTSAAYKLFELYLPKTQPTSEHAEASLYRHRPPIHHTFRAEPSTPPSIISLVFAISLIVPWAVLFGLLSRIPHSLPHLFSPKILPFVALLAACEGLLFVYWVSLRLPDVLLYGSILAVPTLITGKRALGALVQWRLGEKQ